MALTPLLQKRFIVGRRPTHRHGLREESKALRLYLDEIQYITQLISVLRLRPPNDVYEKLLLFIAATTT